MEEAKLNDIQESQTIDQPQEEAMEIADSANDDHQEKTKKIEFIGVSQLNCIVRIQNFLPQIN